MYFKEGLLFRIFTVEIFKKNNGFDVDLQRKIREHLVMFSDAKKVEFDPEIETGAITGEKSYKVDMHIGYNQEDSGIRLSKVSELLNDCILDGNDIYKRINVTLN